MKKTQNILFLSLLLLANSGLIYSAERPQGGVETTAKRQSAVGPSSLNQQVKKLGSMGQDGAATGYPSEANSENGMLALVQKPFSRMISPLQAWYGAPTQGQKKYYQSIFSPRFNGTEL